MKKLILTSIIFVLIISMLTACGSDDIAPGETVAVNVALEGGSGKASVSSPAELRKEEDGTYTATICWSSSNYDYMVVDGTTYKPVNTEGNSVFEIPVPSAQCRVDVQADTVAMSRPHLIDYTLVFGESAPGDAAGQKSEDASENVVSVTSEAASDTDFEPLIGLTQTGSIELDYAKEFTVDYYNDDLALVTIAGEDRFLIVPEGVETPDDLPEDVTVLKKPLNNIYMVASGMMDMFAACDGMDSLGFCALEKDDWYIDAARTAMEENRLSYAGKYSAPDYEQLTDGGCSLAIENTMVLHSPEVVEELNNLGIPVIIEHSSYEDTPQGRMEWVKLAGLLTDCEDKACEAFDKQIEAFEAVGNLEASQKSAAFFYITATGSVSVRNASDYIPKMIELAGGKYAFSDLGTDSDNTSSNLQMEEFYARSLDTDYLIYNGTIEGELGTLDDFLKLSPLLSDLRAVKDGNVYCTRSSLYQSSMELGEITRELQGILSGNDDGLEYFYRLK